jgi:hypothetical protein
MQFTNSIDGDAMLAKLHSFAFVAIFPFYNHVDEILKCIRKMTSLQTLFIKLCPEPGSTVLQEGIEMTGGHLDVNDPWNECETSWMLIAHTLAYLTTEGSLQELRMDDVKVAAVRSRIVSTLTKRLDQWWVYQGHDIGRWQRKVPLNA